MAKKLQFDEKPVEKAVLKPNEVRIIETPTAEQGVSDKELTEQEMIELLREKFNELIVLLNKASKMPCFILSKGRYGMAIKSAVTSFKYLHLQK